MLVRQFAVDTKHYTRLIGVVGHDKTIIYNGNVLKNFIMPVKISSLEKDIKKSFPISQLSFATKVKYEEAITKTAESLKYLRNYPYYSYVYKKALRAIQDHKILRTQDEIIIFTKLSRIKLSDIKFPKL